MSAPKSILKKPKIDSGSSKTRLSGSKGKATLSLPQKAIPSQLVKPGPASDEMDDDEEEDDEGFGGLDDGADEDEEMDTDEEIEVGSVSSSGRGKVGNKRKRPTTASQFGTTLTSLLADPAPSSTAAPRPTPSSTIAKNPTTSSKPSTSTVKTAPTATSRKSTTKTKSKAQPNPILSLSKTKLPPTLSTERLNRQAARQIAIEKSQKEDRARITDVLEGWIPADGVSGSGEFERGLRKTAQRGVIKLFNAILLAAKSSESAATTLSAKAGVRDEAGRRKEKDNLLGRGGKEAGLTKEGFLDLVRKG